MNEPTQPPSQPLSDEQTERLLQQCPAEERLADDLREAMWNSIAERLGAPESPRVSESAESAAVRSSTVEQISPPTRSRRPIGGRLRWLIAAAAILAVMFAGAVVVRDRLSRLSTDAGGRGRTTANGATATEERKVVAATPSVGRVDEVRGACEKAGAADQAAGRRHPLTKGGMIHPGDLVVAGQGAGIHVLLDDGSALWLCSDTETVFEGPRSDTAPVLRLNRGEIRADIAKSAVHPFRLQTPTAAIRVLGTQFNCQVLPAISREAINMNRLRSALSNVIPAAVLVTVLSGSVAVETQAGESLVNQGERTVVTDGKAVAAESVARLDYTKKWLSGPAGRPTPEALTVIPVREYLIQSLWAVNIESGESRHISDFVGVSATVKQRFGPDLALVEVSSVIFAHFGSEPIGGSGKPLINSQIFLLDLTTGEKIPMTPLKDCDPLYVDLSPDRRKLAFVGNRRIDTGATAGAEADSPSLENRQFGIFVLDLETFELRNVLEGAMKTCPHWSPDSRWLAVSKAPGYVDNHDIVLIDTITGEVVDTGLNGAGVVFSPDGKRIVYTGGVVRGGGWMAGVPMSGNLILADVATGKSEPLTSLLEGGAVSPCFSPDGSRVVYRLISRNREVPGEIRVVDPVTRADRAVASDEGFDSFQWLDEQSRLLIAGSMGKDRTPAPVRLVDFSATPPTVRSVTIALPQPTAEQVQKARSLGERLFRVFEIYKKAIDAQDFHQIEAAQAGYAEARDLTRLLMDELGGKTPTTGAAPGTASPENLALRLAGDDLEPYFDVFAKEAALTPAERSVGIVRHNLRYYLPSIMKNYYKANNTPPPSAENLAQWAPLGKWQINHIRSTDTERVRRLFVVPGDDPDKVKSSYTFTRMDEQERTAVLLTPVLANGKRLEATYRTDKSGQLVVELREIE